MDGIQFSATADGSVKVERVISGIIIDRFVCIPGEAKIKIKHKSQMWMIGALAILEAESAGVIIEVPPIPPLQESIAQKLERFNAVQRQCEEALTAAEHYSRMLREKE